MRLVIVFRKDGSEHDGQIVQRTLGRLIAKVKDDFDLVVTGGRDLRVHSDLDTTEARFTAELRVHSDNKKALEGIANLFYEFAERSEILDHREIRLWDRYTSLPLRGIKQIL